MGDNKLYDEGDVEVRDVPERERYEIHIDGARVGLAAYDLQDDVIAFTHTETNPELQGRGIAGRLIRDALDDVRRRELTVLPLCSFVAHWISENPDYKDLVSSGRRRPPDLTPRDG